MKPMLLILCISVSLSQCASFDLKPGDKQKVADDVMKNEYYYEDDAKQQVASSLLIVGNVYIRYTSDDPGAQYEPYGRINLKVGSKNLVIWEVGRDDLEVALGSGIEVCINSVIPNNSVQIKGNVKESDAGANPDDLIANLDQTITDLNEIYGKANTYRFNGEDGYVTVTLQLYFVE